MGEKYSKIRKYVNGFPRKDEAVNSPNEPGYIPPVYDAGPCTTCEPEEDGDIIEWRGHAFYCEQEDAPTPTLAQLLVLRLVRHLVLRLRQHLLLHRLQHLVLVQSLYQHLVQYLPQRQYQLLL